MSIQQQRVTKVIDIEQIVKQAIGDPSGIGYGKGSGAGLGNINNDVCGFCCGQNY